MEVILMNDEDNVLIYYNLLFKDYPDVVDVKQLKEMLPNTGTNKIYKLLKSGEIYSKRIDKKYKIPKVSVISYIIYK